MLPKIDYPIHNLKVPSEKKTYKFRPFLVKEEKLLLMAKTAGEPADVLGAIKQVVNNCCLDESFDVDKLAIFDIEYLFLKLRSVSVNNISTVSYRDNDDSQLYNFDINLDEIEIVFQENVDNIIKISDKMGIVMRYPRAAIFDDKEYFESGDNAFYELVLRCMDRIYSGDDVYEVADVPRAEVEAFLDSLDVASYKKMVSFMETSPKLYYKIEYTNQNGLERLIELKSLSDFFSLG